MSDSDRRSPNIEDRGEAKYFHGRKGILADFKERLEFAEQDPKKGTTFLVQAAPGAGKSALLHKCAGIAEEKGWTIVNLRAKSLWDAASLGKSLGLARELKEKEITWRHGYPSLIQRESRTLPAPPDTLDIIEMSRKPLLLLLDEAQRLHKRIPRLRGDQLDDATEFVKSVHNGGIESPVMLAVAGLSATADAFEDLGVSRFKANCYVELGPLKPEAERRVIEDWLKKEGRAKGDPMPWIDAIVRETHGWPQHVAAYAQAAALQIRTDKRAMTPQGLQAVLEAGRWQRTKFYEIRAKGLDEHHRAAIAEAFVSVRKDQTQSKKAIMESLVKAVGKHEADTVFKRALRKGVLDHRNGRYVIPIPSMRRWFIDNYYIERDPPAQSPPGPDFPPDSPFDPPPGEFPLGLVPESGRDIER